MILRQAQDERDVGDGGSFWSGGGCYGELWMVRWWVVGIRQRFRVVVSIRPAGTQRCLAPDSVH